MVKKIDLTLSEDLGSNRCKLQTLVWTTYENAKPKKVQRFHSVGDKETVKNLFFCPKIIVGWCV